MSSESDDVVWVAVKGFSRYSVSNRAEIFDNNKGCLVSQVLTGIPAYKYVNMVNDEGIRKLVRVHRVVAEAFVNNPLPEVFKLVDHIDRDKMNNLPNNLRWTDVSGNQRNLDNSVMIEGQHLLEFVKRYENDRAAYAFIRNRVVSGRSIEDVVEEYELHIKYGRKREIVEWKGSSKPLIELCKELGKDYDQVRLKISLSGWEAWNAIYNTPPTDYYKNSFEIKGDSVNASMWFGSKLAISDHFKVSTSVVYKGISEGWGVKEFTEYDRLDSLRTTVLGFYGTRKEICEHFKVEMSMVSTRMKSLGISFEEAVLAPKQKVKVVSVNGEKITLKALSERFGIEPKLFSNYRSRKNLSVEETLQLFGVDTSSLDIQY